MTVDQKIQDSIRMNPELNAMRAKIARLGALLFDRRLTDVAGGNISARVGEYVCISPRYSGSARQWQLKPEDVLVADKDMNLLDGGGESLGSGVSGELKRIPFLDLELIEPVQVAFSMESLALEVQKRIGAAALDAPPIYLAIYNLARYRDLRRGEDDFGLGSFSSSNDESSPLVSSARRLAEILRDGPLVGVHALMWCDTYNNLMRWFDRQILRDITYRVLFQMTPTDSSNLMDSAAASQLGPHRAVLYDDNRGETERFRPYAWPLVATSFRDDA